MGLFAVSLKVEGENDTRHLLILLALGVVVLALSHIFRFRELIHQRRNALMLEDELSLPADARVLIRRASRRIREAANLDEVWTYVEEAGEMLQVRDVHLTVMSRDSLEDRTAGQWSFHREEPELSRLPKGTLKVPMLASFGICGEVKWTFRTAQGDEDHERRLLIMFVTEAITEFLDESEGTASSGEQGSVG